MASNSDSLYITFVDLDRDLLKVWGQKNRVCISYIERQLSQLIPEFNRTHGPNPSRIRKGMCCFAKSTDGNYYRARIISNVQGDSVCVLFVDYGNKDIINLSNIRVQEGNADVLTKMAEQAEEFYLARVVAPPGGWTKEIVSEIRRQICCEEFVFQIIAIVGDQKILDIQFHNEDFSSFLAKKQLAATVSLSVQKQMILSYCSLVSNETKQSSSVREMPKVNFSAHQQSLGVPKPNPGLPPQQPTNARAPNQHSGNPRLVFQQSNPELHQQYSYGKANNSGNFQRPPGHYPAQGQMASVPQSMNQASHTSSYYTSMNQASNLSSVNENSSQSVNPAFNSMLCNQFNPYQAKGNTGPLLPFNSVVIEALAQQIKQYIAEDNAKSESVAEKIPHHYINNVLEVGSTYNVLISCIDDGPWSFSIQLLSTENELNKLMEELATSELVPIKPPIILGHPCIGYSTLYGNLCRGVIVSISHSAVKVYLVDFGDTEDLPVSAIYELPPKFFKNRVLSQKFSLSGLQKVAYSDDIKRFFKEAVQDALLMLQVTSLEGDNLPTCELYFKDRNIKRILNEKIRESKNLVQELPQAGDTENVVVTWVESPQKFFVQLCKRDPHLNALKKELAEVQTKSHRLTFHQLSVGLTCVCQYASDEQWYRVMITSLESENAITVFYVDYGNTETVNISLLRKFEGPGLINKMNFQAVQCSLKGFEQEPFNQDVANYLETLILEKYLQMKVVSCDNDQICVRLFENGNDIASLLSAAHSKKGDSTNKTHKNDEDFKQPISPAGSNVVTSNAFGHKNKFSEGSESFEKRDNQTFRNERNRQIFSREKSHNSRHFSDFKSDKPQSSTTHTQLKRRFEDKKSWRGDDKRKSDDVDFHPSDKFGTSKGFKPGKENYWSEKKPSGGDKLAGSQGWKHDRDTNEWTDGKSSLNEEKVAGSRGFKQSNDDWKENKSGGRKVKEGNKAGRGKFKDNKVVVSGADGKGFEKKMRNWDESYGSHESKKSVADDRGDAFDKSFSHASGRKDKAEEHKSSRQAIKKEELPPPGSKFHKRIVNIGSSEKAIVTYYLNPGEFYIQLLTHEEDFKKMMHEIQVYYSNKYFIKDPLKIGDIVVAQFSIDGILYRGEVIQPSPLLVRYVDYGNQEIVGPKKAWLVAKQFLEMPKQAIKCRLSNVQPKGSEWPSSESALEKWFEFEEYKCTFLSVENDIYEISMEALDNGKDIAREIIAAELGMPAASKLNVEEIDYSLIPNQILKLYISHVDSSSKFYVIINPEAAEVIERDIKTFAEVKENLISLEEGTLKPGISCLLNDGENSWHRGTIVKIVEDKISVSLNDRGNEIEVTAEKLVRLPEHLKDVQPQAVECCLHGISNSPLNEEEFKNKIEHNYHLVSVKSATNERLSVVLYDQEGRKLNFQKEDESPESIDPIGHLPIITKRIPVKISHLESPEEIYIQRLADHERVANLSQDLGEFYKKNNHDFEIKGGEKEKGLVAAKSVVHDSWYRGRVLSFSENQAEVFFIDVGNKESLPLENVKKLDRSFYNLNVFCRKVSMDLPVSTEVVEQIKGKLLELTKNKELLAYFINTGEDLLVEFTYNGERITRMLKTTDGSGDQFHEILSGEKTSAVEAIKAQPLNRGAGDEVMLSGLKVFVSYVDSPNKFWVHKECMINGLQQFQDSLKKHCQNSPDKENVRIGDIVAAEFADCWYRAEIMNIAENHLTVRFIDYGTVLEVDLNSSKVKEVSQELLNVPIFATCYALKGTWSKGSTSKFEEIILQCEDLLNAVILKEGNPALVDLFKNGQSIADKLMESVRSEEELDNDLCTVYVTHANTPDDFYIQRKSFTGLLDRIDKALLDANSFENVTVVQENGLYAAEFLEDEFWYRAKVMRKDADEIEVFFIDYGNTAIVTEVKRLPKDIAEIPDLAENCSLVYGKNCDSWSEAACETFSKYTDGRPLKMKVVVNAIRKPVVKLFSERGSISEELESLCEEDGRSEVYVTYVHSPTDFYIRYVNDDYFKLLKSKLESGSECEDVEDRRPGTVCQTYFADGSAWRRAKVLRNLDEGCEVFFMDYGNTSVVTELKKLPPEASEIPPRALKCSLNLPQKNIPESVKEEFINLTASGNSVFRARIITPGDLNIISLKLDGRILEQTLCLDSIPEENLTRFYSPSSHRDLSTSLDDETDDDKNSKKNLMTESFLTSNLEDDVRAGSSIRNETDEEKRVKIAISVVDGGSEGFKSDDEKGISEGTVLSSMINATDSELIEESQENVEELLEAIPESNDVFEDCVEGSAEDIASNQVTMEDEIDDDVEENECEVTAIEVFKGEEEENNVEGSRSKENAGDEDGQPKTDLEVRETVPGNTSREESEKNLTGNLASAELELAHSEKLMSGERSSGVSSETKSNENEPMVERSLEDQSSQNSPSTSPLSRQDDSNANGKTNESDSDATSDGVATAIPLRSNPSNEKVSVADKILPASVNGSLPEN